MNQNIELWANFNSIKQNYQLYCAALILLVLWIHSHTFSCRPLTFAVVGVLRLVLSKRLHLVWNHLHHGLLGIEFGSPRMWKMKIINYNSSTNSCHNKYLTHTLAKDSYQSQSLASLPAREYFCWVSWQNKRSISWTLIFLKYSIWEAKNI